MTDAAGAGVDCCDDGRCIRTSRRLRRHRAVLGQACDICRDGADVVIRHARHVFGDRSHRPGRGAVLRLPAGPQIGEKLVSGPGDWRCRGSIERGRIPAFRLAAGIGTRLLFGTEGIARGMARAAMRDALGQIGASVPLRALRSVPVARAALQEKKLPAREQRTNVEGERQLVFRWPVATGSRVMTKA